VFKFLVVDLDSTNGVYLNNERIDQSAELKDSDVIVIGEKDKKEEVRILFHYPMGEMLKHIEKVPREISEPISMEMTSDLPDGLPYLKFRWLTKYDLYLPLEKDKTLLGRGEKADLRFPSNLPYTSSEHVEIRRTRTGFEIVDLNSTNGTSLNGKLLLPEMPATLHHGDIIRIGDEAYGVSTGINFYNPLEIVPIDGFSPAEVMPTKLAKQVEITIGRNPDCDLVIESPKVSRWHARIQAVDSKYWITDLNSLNGTILNGQPITKAPLNNGDQIQIGTQVITFEDGELIQFESYGLRVDVVDLHKDVRTRHGKLRILDDISMSIFPREFIAIVGGSGAGKTTLINALNGSAPADGAVTLNGRDFYKDYEYFRDQIGYIPQTDILHTSLTVERALDYATILRLPPDTTKEERKNRISDVLKTVNLNTDVIRGTRIKNLSGGQRKRISIAAELLADPKLLYLDEPTSGLDPGLEKKMMYTLRHMADQGRTVVLITHATANIVQVDHVAFISQGKLVYFGPPQEALEFFEVDDFADIYERIEKHGDEWRQVFVDKKPRHYQRYVIDRQRSKKGAVAREAVQKIKFGIGKFFRQLAVLTRRGLNIQAADLITLVLLAALYPFTAILQLVISSPDVIIGDPGILADPIGAAKVLVESYVPLANTRVFVFITALEAVLIGMYVPSNELILERSVYLRERMVNIRVLPYLLSKVLMFSLFGLIQCILYLIVLSLGVDLPEQGLYFPAPVEMFITIFITIAASIGIGLFISSLARSPEMAMYVLVMLLFFQFFFAGIIFDLRDKPAEMVSYFSTTRWSMVALGVTLDLDEMAESIGFR
jgi:ABC-type multidrug transport system ATPase subunit/nucleoside-triphosphatase THEP1